MNIDIDVVPTENHGCFPIDMLDCGKLSGNCIKRQCLHPIVAVLSCQLRFSEKDDSGVGAPKTTGVMGHEEG